MELKGFKEMTKEEHTNYICELIREQDKKQKIQRVTKTYCGKTKSLLSLTFEY